MDTGNDTSVSFRSAAALRSGELMWQVFPPFLIVTGSVGNVLTVLVLSRPSMAKSTYSVYLMALAFADLSMLYVGLLRHWITHVFGMDVRHSSNSTCKVHCWLVYSNADICAWILTVITLERLVSTLCPAGTALVCTRRKAGIIVAAVCLTSMAVNSNLMYGFGRVETRIGNLTTVHPCVPVSRQYKLFFERVWSWIDLCKASLIPFAILTCGNAWIIRTMVKSSKRVRTSMVSSRSNMSKLLVALNFVFVVCTAPICVYHIGDGYWIPQTIPAEVKVRDPVWVSVNLLLYLNNTANFFLYCLSGSKFRQELARLYRDTSNKASQRFSLPAWSRDERV